MSINQIKINQKTKTGNGKETERKPRKTKIDDISLKRKKSSGPKKISQKSPKKHTDIKVVRKKKLPPKKESSLNIEEPKKKSFLFRLLFEEIDTTNSKSNPETELNSKRSELNESSSQETSSHQTPTTEELPADEPVPEGEAAPALKESWFSRLFREMTPASELEPEEDHQDEDQVLSDEPEVPEETAEVPAETPADQPSTETEIDEEPDPEEAPDEDPEPVADHNPAVESEEEPTHQTPTTEELPADEPVPEETTPLIDEKKYAKYLKQKKRMINENWTYLMSIKKYPILGLDISDRSLEVLHLSRQKKVVSYSRSVLPPGVVSNGEIIKQKDFINILRDTLKQAKPKAISLDDQTNIKAVVSLPESKTYIHYFTFKDARNLQDKIIKKIQTTIPLELDNLQWDYVKLNLKEGRVRVVVAAAPRDTIENYIHCLRSSGITPITPVVFEPESISTARALLKNPTTINTKLSKKRNKFNSKGFGTMIVDIGARTSTLSLHDKNGLMLLSTSIPYGGNYFTKQLMSELNISFEQAEELKCRSDLKTDKKVQVILSDPIKKITREIDDAKRYFRHEFGQDLDKVILSGGTSLIPGLKDIFQQETGLKVSLGDPLTKIRSKNILNIKEPILYTNVIGLALRTASKNPVTDGINLLPVNVKLREFKRFKQEHQLFAFLVTVFLILGILLLGFFSYNIIAFPSVDTSTVSQPSSERPIMAEPKTEESLGKLQISDSVVTIYESPEPDARSRDFEIDTTESWEIKGIRDGWYMIEFRTNDVWLPADSVTRSGDPE